MVVPEPVGSYRRHRRNTTPVLPALLDLQFRAEIVLLNLLDENPFNTDYIGRDTAIDTSAGKSCPAGVVVDKRGGNPQPEPSRSLHVRGALPDLVN